MSSTDTGKKLLRRETVKALRGGAKKFEGRRQTVRNRRYLSSKSTNKRELLQSRARIERVFIGSPIVRSLEILKIGNLR